MSEKTVQLRRVGASFDSRKLGYSSTLCALSVPGGPDEVDRVAGIVNEYPNVTHNYLRDHRYNLWFTVIARDAAEVARIVGDIERRPRACGSLEPAGHGGLQDTRRFREEHLERRECLP